MTFAIYLSYYGAACGKITAFNILSRPLEGRCAKQTYLSPDGIKLHNVTFPCEITVLTNMNNKEHFTVDIQHIEF